MAKKPLLETLPADLWAEWTNQQYISPWGLEVGLTTQHGYNYLNKQVNDSQKAINKINEAFSSLAIDSTHVSVYEDHPKSLSSDAADKNYVVKTTTSSETAIPSSKIEILNPWGETKRKIQITAYVQARLDKNSALSYHMGTHIYLFPSLTWSTSVKTARSTLAGSTSKDHIGTVVLNLKDESTEKYPVSLWFKKYSTEDTIHIMNWSMMVVQTKLD